MDRNYFIGATLIQAAMINNVEATRQIISSNPEYFRNPNNIDIIKALLRKDSKTANYEIINQLLSSLKEGASNNKLILAILDGNVEKLKYLLKSGIKVTDWNGNSLSYFALCKTNLKVRKEMLKLLIQYGMDTKFINRKGENLLHQFIIHDYEENDDDAVEIVDIIVNSGTSINEPDFPYGLSPLYNAVVMTKNIKLVELLIKKGADVNKKSKIDEVFPLYGAAETNNVPMADYLLSNGAEVNAKATGGITALHLSCFRNDKKMIDLLIQRGADVTVKTKSGETPLSLLKISLEKYEECIIAIVKQFAVLVFENNSISDKDMNLMKKNLTTYKHFENCKIELKQMTSIKINGTHSFYSIMKSSNDLKQLSFLIKETEFISNFRKNLSRLSYYKNELEIILEKAMEFNMN